MQNRHRSRKTYRNLTGSAVVLPDAHRILRSLSLSFAPKAPLHAASIVERGAECRKCNCEMPCRERPATPIPCYFCQFRLTDQPVLNCSHRMYLIRDEKRLPPFGPNWCSDFAAGRRGASRSLHAVAPRRSHPGLDTLAARGTQRAEPPRCLLQRTRCEPEAIRIGRPAPGCPGRPERHLGAPVKRDWSSQPVRVLRAWPLCGCLQTEVWGNPVGNAQADPAGCDRR